VRRQLVMRVAKSSPGKKDVVWSLKMPKKEGGRGETYTTMGGTVTCPPIHNEGESKK